MAIEKLKVHYRTQT